VHDITNKLLKFIYDVLFIITTSVTHSCDCEHASYSLRCLLKDLVSMFLWQLLGKWRPSTTCCHHNVVWMRVGLFALPVQS